VAAATATAAAGAAVGAAVGAAAAAAAAAAAETAVEAEAEVEGVQALRARARIRLRVDVASTSLRCSDERQAWPRASAQGTKQRARASYAQPRSLGRQGSYRHNDAQSG
jgi:hypothetical protein